MAVKLLGFIYLAPMNICKRPGPDISAWTKALDQHPQSLAAASLKSDAAFSFSNIKILAERHIVSPCKPDLTSCSWLDNWCQENFRLHFKHTIFLCTPFPPSRLFLFKADRIAFEFDWLCTDPVIIISTQVLASTTVTHLIKCFSMSNWTVWINWTYNNSA